MAFSTVLTVAWQIKIKRTCNATRDTWVLCLPGIASLVQLETECQHPVYQKIVVVLMLQVGWTVHTHQWRKALSLVEFVITGIPTVATGKTIFRSKTVALSMFTGWLRLLCVGCVTAVIMKVSFMFLSFWLNCKRSWSITNIYLKRALTLCSYYKRLPIKKGRNLWGLLFWETRRRSVITRCWYYGDTSKGAFYGIGICTQVTYHAVLNFLW